MHRAEVAHAILHVFKVLNKQVNVQSVIINKVRGWQQAEWMNRAIKSATKKPVLAVIPYNAEIILPARRGGLIPIPEKETLKTTLSELVEYVGKHIELIKSWI